jgi:hypothetical protein
MNIFRTTICMQHAEEILSDKKFTLEQAIKDQRRI